MRTTIKQVLNGVRGAEGVLKESRKMVQAVTSPVKVTRSTKGDAYYETLRELKLMLGVNLLSSVSDVNLMVSALLYLFEHVDEIELVDLLPNSKNYFLNKVRAMLMEQPLEQKVNVQNGNQIDLSPK